MLAQFGFQRGSTFGVLLFFWLVVLPQTGKGGPVTLQFELEVDNVVVQGSPELISPLQIGDRVHGQFTFDPIDAQYTPLGAVTTIASAHPLSLRWDNVIMAAADYQIESRDNVNVIDNDAASEDALFVNNVNWDDYEVLGDWGLLPGRLAFGFTMEPGNVGGDILHGPDIPANPGVWNAFARRRFSMFFLDENDLGWISVSGSIDVTSIPESETFTLVFLITGFALMCQMMRSRIQV